MSGTAIMCGSCHALCHTLCNAHQHMHMQQPEGTKHACHVGFKHSIKHSALPSPPLGSHHIPAASAGASQPTCPDRAAPAAARPTRHGTACCIRRSCQRSRTHCVAGSLVRPAGAAWWPCLSVCRACIPALLLLLLVPAVLLLLEESQTAQLERHECCASSQRAVDAWPSTWACREGPARFEAAADTCAGLASGTPLGALRGL